MERTRIIVHRGKRIVLVDFSGLRVEQAILSEIEKAAQFFDRQAPDGSLLTLTDGTDALYTRQTMEATKRLAAHNKPFVRVAAAVVNSRLLRVLAMAVSTFSGRKIPLFPTREEALDWLVHQ